MLNTITNFLTSGYFYLGLVPGFVVGMAGCATVMYYKWIKPGVLG